MIDCKKTIELLYPYLDRELSPEELKEVHDHLEMCPPCAKHFEFESGMLHRISDACRSVETPSGLREKIVAACSQISGTPRSP